MDKPPIYKTVLQVEILSEGEFASDLPIDKFLSYLEYEGTFGHNSNYIKVISSAPVSADELEEECQKHGTDPNFFLDSDRLIKEI